MAFETNKAIWLRAAIAQGISVPIFYASATLIGGLYHPGYSHISQAVSELSAAGAPNQNWLLAAFTVVEILTFIFGLGYYLSVRKINQMLSISAMLVAAIGVIGLGFARFPMDQVGTAMTSDGEMHLVIVAISALLAVVAVTLAGLGWKRHPGGKQLASLSFLLLGAMLLSGVLSGFTIANEWPGIGIWQRINIGAFSLWQICTAIHIWRLA